MATAGNYMKSQVFLPSPVRHPRVLLKPNSDRRQLFLGLMEGGMSKEAWREPWTWGQETSGKSLIWLLTHSLRGWGLKLICVMGC